MICLPKACTAKAGIHSRHITSPQKRALSAILEGWHSWNLDIRSENQRLGQTHVGHDKYHDTLQAWMTSSAHATCQAQLKCDSALRPTTRSRLACRLTQSQC